MTRLVHAALVLTVLLTGALSTTANAARRSHESASSSWTDLSDPYGGYGPNTQEGERAFWDYQARHGH